MRYSIVEIDKKWGTVPIGDYKRAYNRYKGLLGMGELIDELCSHLPQPGHLWKPEILVVIPIGDGRDEHAHKQHTLVYYINACSPVQIEGVNVFPENGQAIILEPGVMHSVPTNNSNEERVSLGLLWETP